MAITKLAKPKPVAKKTASPVAKKTAAKKPAQETGEVMLWADIVKKYPGYHIIIKDPVHPPRNKYCGPPVKGEVFCAHKDPKQLTALFLQKKRTVKAKLYAFVYIEDPKDANKPRPVFI
ncbi:MAG: hypothetical protein LBS94_04715 [Prevotellaceae bacterium]|jgi:hypothetical protein|nr:hypothetical protein [Prevotellaceae bacterium]